MDEKFDVGADDQLTGASAPGSPVVTCTNPLFQKLLDKMGLFVISSLAFLARNDVARLFVGLHLLTDLFLHDVAGNVQDGIVEVGVFSHLLWATLFG